MTIPYYCQRFADYLLNSQPLPDHVDIARFEKNQSMVSLAKRYLSEKLEPGDVVIDATIGNGYDTEFLARCVGPNGLVYGFDVQRTAMERTSQRLKASGLDDRVILVNCSHEYMSQQVPERHHKTIKAIVFNLGYLPGHNSGDNERIVTGGDSTRTALNDALGLLQRRGLLTMVVYPGHHGGAEEFAVVARWVEQLDSQQYICQWFGKTPHSTRNSPMLLTVEKH